MGVEFRTIRELYEITYEGSQIEKDSLDLVEIEGWVRTNRCNGKLGSGIKSVLIFSNLGTKTFS